MCFTTNLRIFLLLSLVIGFIACTVMVTSADTLLDDDFTSLDTSFWLPVRVASFYEAGYPEVFYTGIADGRSALFMQSSLHTNEARGYESRETYLSSQVSLAATIKPVSGALSSIFSLSLSPDPTQEIDLVCVYLTASGIVRGSVWIGGTRYYTPNSSTNTWQLGNWYTIGFDSDSAMTRFFMLDESGEELWSGTLPYTIQQINSAGPSYIRFNCGLYAQPSDNNAVYVDRVTLTSSVVTGTITLKHWSGITRGMPAVIEIRDGTGATLEKKHVTLESNGGFNFDTSLADGSYTAVAKSGHWLAKAMPVTISDGSGSVSFELTNGDCNGDNGVDEIDYAILSTAWYQAVGDPRYNPDADLLGDGSIDEIDYAILSNAWYTAGD